MIPGINFVVPWYLHIGPLNHNIGFHTRARLDCLIGVLFGRNGLGTSKGPVTGDQNLCFTVLDPVTKGVCGESTEYDAVDGPNPRAGQHGNRKFGNHRQINRHPVALLDPFFLEHICELTHLFM